jgi:integrase
MIALAAITGCRRGELAGLKWDDLDATARTLRVCRQWVPGKGGQYLTDETKTGKERTVYIGAEGVALLDRYRDAKTEELGRKPEGWLLSYNGGETPLRAKSMTEYVSALAKSVKVPAHLHTLRLWKATELNAQGVDLPTAASQMGHSIGVMSETYLHSSDDRAAAAGELIATVVASAIDPESTSDTDADR